MLPHFLEVVVVARVNVLIHDVNIIVTIRATLLVPETNHVTKLMNNDADSLATISERKQLTAAAHAHV